VACPTVLGDRSKDGTDYRLNPLTGKLKWKTRVVFGEHACAEKVSSIVSSLILTVDGGPTAAGHYGMPCVASFTSIRKEGGM